MQKTDTIAAVATAQGQGGIGIVRISGPASAAFAAEVLGKLPEPRRATYTSFLNENREAIDQGIAIFFPAPNSFTGEDVLELQGHGGPAVLQMILQRCLNLGARLAEPGEFTRRAFLNDKIDLTQAESVADLISATTTEAARSAMRSLQGEFSEEIHALLESLVKLRMRVEAMLDFPEEEIDDADTCLCRSRLQALKESLQKTLKAAKQGSLLRNGAHIALLGKPNVGKSSLLNRLSGHDVALVSNVPGTTRDVIREAIQIRGIPLHIMDTAGLRESGDEIENMGMARTRQAAEKADLILLLLDASNGRMMEDEEIISGLPRDIPHLLVCNKADLLGKDSRRGPGIYVSAKSGEGMDELRDEILRMIGWRHQEGGSFIARERHLAALNETMSHVDRAFDVLQNPELLAEELRMGQQALNSITGRFSPDDLLGEIFSHFCIGK